MVKKILIAVAVIFIFLVLVNAGKDSESDYIQPVVVTGDVIANEEWGNLRKVDIMGYNGNAQEPFITRDSKYLFFNDYKPEDKGDQKSMHWATRIDDTTFDYQGLLEGANVEADVDGAPSMDKDGNFYWISTGTYFDDNLTVYRGTFDGTNVSDISKIDGDYHRDKKPYVNFDVEVSKTGEELYIVDGLMEDGGPIEADFLLVDKYGNKLDQSIIASVNSSQLEYAASISSDDLELYFTRLPELNFNADVGIYVAKRDSVSEPFGVPERITAVGTGFLEAPAINDEGNLFYFHKFNDKKFDIYVVER